MEIKEERENQRAHTHTHTSLYNIAPGESASQIESEAQSMQDCKQEDALEKFLLYPHDLYPLIVNARETNKNTIVRRTEQMAEFRANTSYRSGLLRRKIFLLF